MDRVLKILVAFECFGRVRDALIRLGHNAISCDLMPSKTQGPHIQGNALRVMYGEFWDMMIAFYPCTDLAVSGAKHFYYKRAAQFKAVQEARQVMNAPIEKISFENPIGMLSSYIRKPDQIIHPWMFGHMEEKRTCLWLKNLPPLMQTDNVYAAMMALPKRERERVHRMPPGPDRGMIRSITYQGVADAMATQWAGA